MMICKVGDGFLNVRLYFFVSNNWEWAAVCLTYLPERPEVRREVMLRIGY